MKCTIPNSFLLKLLIPSLFFSLFICSCRQKSETLPEAPPAPVQKVNARFTLMDPGATGVDFVNHMREDYNYNNFVFEYMYNGGGVAAGDVNGDGLPDLYFSSSRFSNKLYLNKGNFQFIDVTDMSGVGAKEGFKTGVAMADVNGDGLLDIYVCRTSKSDDGLKNDILYINKGVKDRNGINIPFFEDEAAKMGIQDNSNTNHCCFFDFDRDGDLDLFLVNHKLGFMEANKLRIQQKEDGSTVRYTEPETPFESNRLFRNDNNHFTDITHQAGVTSSAYSLSATAADLNNDGWLDLYVANDYVEPDFVYINNHNGTFTDHYKDYLKHGSHSSMGADITDFNNDGLVDIMVLEMKPEDPIRYKELMNIMLYDRYNMMVQHGYGRQVGRNVLQLNNGNNTFSEIGQYAGVATTDWSWGVLMADFDNDGWKDMYISNGYRKDVSQLDYLNYFRDSLAHAGGLTSAKYPDINDFLKYLPEQKVRGYLYLNDKNLSFYDATNQAGMNQLSFSNGSAYADLDQDGDLDIIVNNIDDPAFIYRNDVTGEHWLQIDPEGTKGNTQAVGAYVEVHAGKDFQYQMVMANKGFFSTSEMLLHFGLGDVSTVDSVILHWPDGQAEIMTNLRADQRIVWTHGTGQVYHTKPLLSSAHIFTSQPTAMSWKHDEQEFIDVKRERLIPYFISADGPCLVVGDVNGDKLDDVYAGNGQGFASGLLIQQPSGKFEPAGEPAFTNDASFEDCGGVFEDVDGDQDEDLIVISGGYALPMNDPGYMTRLYLNDGKGNFTRDASFPVIRTNAGSIVAFDFDQDGDKDLFIGGRCLPGRFPTPEKSYLLQNDKGHFVNVTQTLFPAFEKVGMVTDLEEADLDGDGKPELIVSGEWMPLRIFSFDGKSFVERTDEFGLAQSSGWWKCITAADVDNDGDMDIVAGNIGLNNRFHTSEARPITLVTKDFDGNGSLDPIMCYYYQDKLYPYAQRDAIIGQIPSLKKKFTRYNPYAKATLEDVFSKDDLKGAERLEAKTFRTTFFRNDNHKFVAVELPYECQLSPVYDIVTDDFNGDGRMDLLMVGNFLYAETETGEMDAGNGTLLLQQADGSFEFIPNAKHGFWAQHEARDLKMVKMENGKKGIVTGNNRGPLELTTINTK